MSRQTSRNPAPKKTVVSAPTSPGRMKTDQTGIAYTHISEPTLETVCKVGAGVLHGIAINDPNPACVLTIYNGDVATGDVIGRINLTTKVITPFFMDYSLPFSTGLAISTSAVSDFTIIFD